jgi:hypothetical protein
MAMCDYFVILKEVDFEKNGYQNRYFLNTKNKWITKPVTRDGKAIKEKRYTDGRNLLNVNMQMIFAIRELLGINTSIVYDFVTTETKTKRLIDIIKHYGGTTYITCPEAKDKYLDEDLMRANGIEIEYYTVPKHLKKNVFELFEEIGISSAISQLPVKIKETNVMLSSMFKESVVSERNTIGVGR